MGIFTQIFPAKVEIIETPSVEPRQFMGCKVIIFKHRSIRRVSAVVGFGYAMAILGKKLGARIGRDHIEVGKCRIQPLCISRHLPDGLLRVIGKTDQKSGRRANAQLAANLDKLPLPILAQAYSARNAATGFRRAIPCLW